MLQNFDKLPQIFSQINSLRDGTYVEGILPIEDSDNNTLFEYKISIDFRILPPTVKELEGLIPHHIDRHVFPKQDWSLCLGYPIMLLSFWVNSKFDCLSYVKNMVLPYLANQHYYDRNGEWLVKGLDHDINGAIQFYSAIFGTNDVKIISYRLINILKNRKYRLNDLCFCGSNLKYKNCHRKKQLLPIERKLLEWDYSRFRKHLTG